MAKKKKVPGWHTMKKSELIKALVRRSRADAARRARATSGNGDNPAAGPKPKPVNHKVAKRIEQIQEKLAEAKDLAFHSMGDTENVVKDRLVVMVRDPYWLHAYWEISRKSMERVKVALGQYWHAAKPVLRVYEVLRDGTTTAIRQPIRDVVVHGGVNNWYIDVQNPPKTYQLDLGYVSPGNRFHCVARSNVVSTPPAAAADSFDKNWADVAKEYDRIFALSGGYSEPEANTELREVFEERLQRPIGDPVASLFGATVIDPLGNDRPFEFEVDAELIIHGVTQPEALVTLRGEPVKIRSDGTFAVRFNLPDRRHVLPMVASSRDGSQQRTVVLSIDRNTRVMELVHRDPTE